MSHLIRAGLGLVVVVALVVTLRTVILQGGITASEFGLRPRLEESDIAMWRGQPLQHAESLTCARDGCHEGAYDLWVTSSHGSVACETCHGPALAHVFNVEVPLPVDDHGELCELCHASSIARPPDHPQVVPAEHYPESTCMACHEAHRPGPPPLIRHPVSEGSDCLLCHAPDSPVDRAVPPTHIGRTNDICLTCHEEAK